jgi:hypothetical protein
MRRLWIFFVSVMAAGIAGYFFLPSGAQTLLYDAVAVSAGIAMLAAVVWGRTEPRAAWLLVGLGVLSFAAGDVAFGDGQPVPSIADMFYISAYPLLIVGLAVLGTRRRTSHLSTALSATLVTGMVVFVSWVFMVLPGPGGYGSEVVTRVVALGYPFLDLVLLALLARAIAVEGTLPGTYALFGGALFLWLVADTAFALEDFGATYAAGHAMDALWLLAYAGFGAAALHPSAWGVVALVERRDVSVVSYRLVGQGTVRDVEFRSVIAWAGRTLLALSTASIGFGTAWKATELIVLGGTYAMTGAMMCLVGMGRRTDVAPVLMRRSGLRSAA